MLRERRIIYCDKQINNTYMLFVIRNYEVMHFEHKICLLHVWGMNTYNSKKVKNTLQFIETSIQLAAHRNDQELRIGKGSTFKTEQTSCPKACKLCIWLILYNILLYRIKIHFCILYYVCVACVTLKIKVCSSLKFWTVVWILSLNCSCLK